MTDLTPRTVRERYFNWFGRVDGLTYASELIDEGINGDERNHSDLVEVNRFLDEHLTVNVIPAGLGFSDDLAAEKLLNTERDAIIADALKLAARGVQEDDGYTYSVAAAELNTYQQTIRNLVALLNATVPASAPEPQVAEAAPVYKWWGLYDAADQLKESLDFIAGDTIDIAAERFRDVRRVPIAAGDYVRGMPAPRNRKQG